MISLQQVSYIHPNRDLLFENINLSIDSQEKIALIGNNGVGKSTLLRMMAGDLSPSAGIIHSDTRPLYIPQVTGEYDEFTVAQALGIDKKLEALYAILNGDASEQNFNDLQEDWTLEERCQEAFRYWNLPEIHLKKKMSDLSGGQKTKILLAGIQIHACELILLDEPSNHLDFDSKKLLYRWIRIFKANHRCRQP